MVAYPSLRTGVSHRPHRPDRPDRPLAPALAAAVAVVRKLLAVGILLCAFLWTLGGQQIRPAAANEPVSVVRIAGPTGARLTVDDHDVGTFPLAAPLALAPGEYRVEATLPGYAPFETKLSIDDAGGDRFVQVRLDRYRRKHAWTSNLLFAGLGQHYLDKPVKGYFFNLIEATGLLAALAGQARFDNYREDYLLLKDSYDTAINAEEIARYQEAADEAYRQMEDAENLRNTGLLIAAGAIVVSIIDVLLFFPAVEAGPGPVPPVVGQAAPAAGRLDDNPWRSAHAGVVLQF